MIYISRATNWTGHRFHVLHNRCSWIGQPKRNGTSSFFVLLISVFAFVLFLVFFRRFFFSLLCEFDNNRQTILRMSEHTGLEEKSCVNSTSNSVRIEQYIYMNIGGLIMRCNRILYKNNTKSLPDPLSKLSFPVLWYVTAHLSFTRVVLLSQSIQTEVY